MKRIYSSATKLVFIFLAISFSIMTFKGIIEPKDFVTGVMMVLTYYFTKAQTQKEISNESSYMDDDTF